MLLEGASIFTKLDLFNTYHLVRIREGNEWKTATCSIRTFLFIWISYPDILIFSKSWEEYVHHVQTVL